MAKNTPVEEVFLDRDSLATAVFQCVVTDIDEAADLILSGGQPSDWAVLNAVDGIRWLHSGTKTHHAFWYEDADGFKPQAILPTTHVEACESILKGGEAQTLLRYLEDKGLVRAAFRASKLYAAGGFEGRSGDLMIHRAGKPDRNGQVSLF